jgi:hypothetical protein
MPRHSKTHIPLEPLLWDSKSELKGKPWCLNWKEMIENPKAKALNINKDLK